MGSGDFDPGARGGAEEVVEKFVAAEVVVRALAGVILRKAGYRVVEVPDAMQGLKLLRGGLKIDLVCSDIMLPGMSGLELKEELRREFSRLPVVLMSGYFQIDPDSMLSQEEGAKILRKPFTPEELLAAVAGALRM